jgi:DNA-binding transcriptional LysR family regulator
MADLDDLRLLRTFVRIAESNSISAAARALNSPQPTVSRQLRQLEEAAGVVLVRRDTHDMSLTSAGERLLKDARGLLNFAEICTEHISDERDSVQGHLKILAVLDTGQWIVPPLLAKFRKLHPAVTAELHLTNRPSKFIAEGFDCGILVGAVTDQSLAVRKAGELRPMLVASPELMAAQEAPRSPGDLKRLPWMGVLQPHFFLRDRVALRRGREHRIVHLSPVLVMDGVTALREAAIAGAGMTQLPEWLAASALKAGKLVQVLPQWSVQPVPVHIVFPNGRLPRRLRSFVDFMSAELLQSCAALQQRAS